MGLGATLAGFRVTDACMQIPKWGRSYTIASLDGEHEVSGAVELVVGDLVAHCFVLASKPEKGRTPVRLVAGNGGWGKTIPKKDYTNDAGVRTRTVLEDAARECGEVFDSASVSADARLGPAWTRPEGPAIDVLDLIAPRGWYVGEDGATRVGARAGSDVGPKIPRVQEVDHARATVVLASESIATILPGITVDGLTAVDVEHKISAKGGIRSTVYGARNGGSARALDAFASMLDAVDPSRKFRGVTEYRVVTQSGNRLDLQCVRSSLGMPDLSRVFVRPGVSGCSAEVALGSTVLVGFANSDPARPYVAAFEDADGDGFIPTTLTLQAGAMVGGEPIATVPGVVLFVYNTLVALMLAAGGGPLLAAVLQPLLATALTAAITAQGAPAPPGELAQEAAAALLQAGFAAGTTPSNAMFAAWEAALATLATKTANVSGKFPSLGSKAVKAG